MQSTALTRRAYAAAVARANALSRAYAAAPTPALWQALAAAMRKQAAYRLTMRAAACRRLCARFARRAYATRGPVALWWQARLWAAGRKLAGLRSAWAQTQGV